MNIKKFNMSAKPAASDPADKPSSMAEQEKLIEYVAEIQVGSAPQEIKLVPKKRKAFTKHIIAIVFFSLFAVFVYVLPIPRPIQKALIFITDRINDSKYTFPAEWHSLSKKDDKNTQAVLLPFPPASDKTMQDESLSTETPISDNQIPVSVSRDAAFSNETSYSISPSDIISQYPITKIKKKTENPNEAVNVFSDSDQPSVLIIHTHGTEGYADSALSNHRTTDKSRNVVAVGKRLAQKLEENGIGTIHCQEMFDKDSYIKAYGNSFSAVSEYLLQYPSIKYVIDLHRDAVPDGSKNSYAKLTADIDGTSCAQLMLVVGTDEAGAVHPEWRRNLSCAINIQNELCQSYPTLMRSINLRRASFNQQLCPGYFILEAGNCSADINEVFASVDIFAECFSKTVTEDF